MTALKDSAALAQHGLTYWAPGPVAGTLWALDADGSSVIFDVKAGTTVTADRGTPAQIKAARHAAALQLALSTPGTRVRYQAGAQPIGLERPLPAHCGPVVRNRSRDEHPAGLCFAFTSFDRNGEAEHACHGNYVPPIVELEAFHAAALETLRECKRVIDRMRRQAVGSQFHLQPGYQEADRAYWAAAEQARNAEQACQSARIYARRA